MNIDELNKDLSTFPQAPDMSATNLGMRSVMIQTCNNHFDVQINRIRLQGLNNVVMVKGESTIDDGVITTRLYVGDPNKCITKEQFDHLYNLGVINVNAYTQHRVGDPDSRIADYERASRS